MSNEISKNKKTVSDTEIGNSGVVHSKVQGSSAGATAEELSLALAMTQKTVETLLKENEQLRTAAANKPQSTSDDILVKLTKALEGLKPANVQAGPAESDNINRTSDFQNKMTVDGRSLMEAQQTLLMFKNESKRPISIAKAFQNQFGPSLAITVNGVRVAIPVDGKTYYINETHWEHARERIAKVDRLMAKTEPEIVETNA